VTTINGKHPWSSVTQTTRKG